MVRGEKPNNQAKGIAKKPKIFLAGPLFSAGERAICRLLLDVLRDELGYEVFWAWDTCDEEVSKRLQIRPKAGWQAELRMRQRNLSKINVAIFESDKRLLDRSDIVIAVLDGADVDSGTAWEIGYAYAKGKPIIGIKSDFRFFAPGQSVNLMIEESIKEHGELSLIHI